MVALFRAQPSLTHMSCSGLSIGMHPVGTREFTAPQPPTGLQDCSVLTCDFCLPQCGVPFFGGGWFAESEGNPRHHLHVGVLHRASCLRQGVAPTKLYPADGGSYPEVCHVMQCLPCFVLCCQRSSEVPASASLAVSCLVLPPEAPGSREPSSTRSGHSSVFWPHLFCIWLPCFHVLLARLSRLRA